MVPERKTIHDTEGFERFVFGVSEGRDHNMKMGDVSENFAPDFEGQFDVMRTPDPQYRRVKKKRLVLFTLRNVGCANR